MQMTSCSSPICQSQSTKEYCKNPAKKVSLCYFVQNTICHVQVLSAEASASENFWSRGKVYITSRPCWWVLRENFCFVYVFIIYINYYIVIPVQADPHVSAYLFCLFTIDREVFRNEEGWFRQAAGSLNCLLRLAKAIEVPIVFVRLFLILVWPESLPSLTSWGCICLFSSL